MGVCGGSLYAHAESIREGYVAFSDGIRVGGVGRAAVEGGRIVDVRDTVSLCFRIPGDVRMDVTPLVSLFGSFGRTRGLLVYAPPGGGKTTVLRHVARALSQGRRAMRVVVVDTRCELESGLSGQGLCVDILSGYPRGRGIDIAARSMGAEVIVCDEICGMEGADVILATQGGGVPLVASAHASDLEGLLSRGDMAKLHAAGTFGAYVRVDRRAPSLFEITLHEEVGKGS